MFKKVFVLSTVLILAVVMSACSAAAAQVPDPTAQPQTAPRTVSVTGSAQVHLAPDIAYITIGVHTESATAGEAVSSNNDKAQKVADALKAQGIDPKDIQTTNFSIYPNQQFGPNGENKGTTYMVDNSVFVTLRDLSKMGTVLTAATDAGANSISGIQFDVADKTDALSQARQKAVADAKKTADELANAAGVTLGPVQNISYTTGSVPIPMYDARGGGAAAPAISVPISPGQITVSVDVTVAYQIQ